MILTDRMIVRFRLPQEGTDTGWGAGRMEHCNGPCEKSLVIDYSPSPGDQ